MFERELMTGGMQNSCSVQLTVDDYKISVCDFFGKVLYFQDHPHLT